MPDGAAEAGNQPRLTQNGPRLAVQVVLALLAVLLLLWLANIVVQYDDAVLSGLAEAVSQDGWIGITIFLLIVILAIEVLLLVPGIAQRMPEPMASFFSPPEYEYLMGCSGCGTVFDRREEELEDDRFACPHCGREGELQDREPHPTHDIASDTCKECGTEYQKFRDVAECPACHVAQD